MCVAFPSGVKCYVDHSLSDRMPIIIGNFISRHVYHSKLLTEHHINTMSCCRFVDVVGGKEVRKGMSWTVFLPSKLPFRLASPLKPAYCPE